MARKRSGTTRVRESYRQPPNSRHDGATYPIHSQEPAPQSAHFRTRVESRDRQSIHARAESRTIEHHDRIVSIIVATPAEDHVAIMGTDKSGEFVGGELRHIPYTAGFRVSCGKTPQDHSGAYAPMCERNKEISAPCKRFGSAQVYSPHHHDFTRRPAGGCYSCFHRGS